MNQNRPVPRKFQIELPGYSLNIILSVRRDFRHSVILLSVGGDRLVFGPFHFFLSGHVSGRPFRHL